MTTPINGTDPDPGVEWSGVESTDSDVFGEPPPASSPVVPQPASNGAENRESKIVPTTKQPPWWARPELVAVGGLLFVLAELVTFGRLGWLYWLAVNAAAAGLVFAAMLAWRGKLGRLWRGKKAGGGSSRGARRGGAGGGRWPGVKAGRGLRGLLGGRSAGTAAGGRKGGPGRGLRGLLGAGRAGGARGKGQGTRPRRWPGLRLGARRPGRSTTGRARRVASATPPGKAGGSKGLGRGKKPGQASLLKPFINGVKQGVAGSGKHKGPPPVAGSKPSGTAGGEPEGGAGPGKETKGSEEKGEPMGVDFAEDQSFQRWGRNLSGLDEYAAEVSAAYSRAEEAAEAYREAARKISEQASTEMPASPRLVAEVESVAGRARQAASADDWKAVASEASVLPGLYQMEHETDEDRVNNPRGSHHAEMRADVTAAVQDN